MKTRNSIIISICVSSFFIVFALFFFVVSVISPMPELMGLGIQPMDFPKVVLGLMLAFAIVNLIIAVKEAFSMQADGKEKGSSVINPRIIVGMLSLVVYALMWQILGFSLSSVLYLFGVAYFLDTKIKWWQALLVAVGFTVLVNIIFVRFFAIIFPEPLWDIIWRMLFDR